MSDMVNNNLRAARAYNTVCAALDSQNWRYTKYEKDLVVNLRLTGEDLPMELILMVDAERQLLRMITLLPFHFSEDKRAEAAAAIALANYGLVDGGFRYDLYTGKASHHLVIAFHGCELSREAVLYGIHCSFSIVDKYNDLLLALNKGIISLKEFAAKA